jgi:hypothetical protein
MCPLQRVTDTEAGPDAVGLLLPPGRLTFLIIRPRSLGCDLLLLRSADHADFRAMPRDEATLVAQKVYRALERWIDRGDGQVAPVEQSGSEFWLQARIGSWFFLVCPRQPGQPYQPQTYTDLASAQSAAEELARALCPSPQVVQEIYFNIRHFTP